MPATPFVLTASGNFMPILEPETMAAKAEAQRAADQHRLSKLPKAVRDWAGAPGLAVPDLELLGAIVAAEKAAGSAAVHVTGATFAQRLKAEPEDLRARLGRLVAAGAVLEVPRLQALPVYRTALSESSMVAKAEANRWGALGVRHRV